MLIQHIKHIFDTEHLKEDLRKLGINFITAGIVGIFVNHLVGSVFSTMFWGSVIITPIGILSLFLGLFKRRK